MSLPINIDGVKLTLEAEEAGTEIFLLDDQSRVIQREVGRLETSQPPGVYKIKLRAGYADREEIVLLEEAPVIKTYPALPFYSPIPLDGTAARIESHAKAAERFTGEATPVVIGNGSGLFLFARDFPRGDEERTPVVENPMHGLSLKNVSGETLIDLQERAEVHHGEEPWAACLIELDPGSYVISLKAPDGAVTDQIVYAAKDWHTQVFVTQRSHLKRIETPSGEIQEETLRLPDISSAGVLVTRGKYFSADDPNARLAELARLNLSSRRQVLAGKLREMLDKKFEQPMLGIYAAHLLLLEKELDAPLFAVVIKNLRILLGNSHPDVEALALVTSEDGSSHIFNTPPMLRASWSLVVRATAKRRDLVPLGSMSAQMADCVLGNEPWLMWVPPGQVKQSTAIVGSELDQDAHSDLFAALEAFAIPHQSTLITLPALIGDVLTERYPIYSKLVGSAQEVIAKVVHWVNTEYGISLEHSAQTRSSSLKFTDKQIETLVDSLALPRYNVEQLLNKSAPRIHAKLERLEREATVKESASAAS